MEWSVCHSDWPQTIHKTKDPSVKHRDEAAARWKADCRGCRCLWQHSLHLLGNFQLYFQHVNAFYTISCYLVFHVQPCQMTSSPPERRTHHPTDDRD